VIVGVTGPISIFTVTVYQLCKNWSIPFLGFMCWINIWTGLGIILLAVLNLCSLVKVRLIRFLPELLRSACS
jgi:boron transporter